MHVSAELRKLRQRPRSRDLAASRLRPRRSADNRHGRTKKSRATAQSEAARPFRAPSRRHGHARSDDDHHYSKADSTWLRRERSCYPWLRRYRPVQIANTRSCVVGTHTARPRFGRAPLGLRLRHLRPCSATGLRAYAAGRATLRYFAHGRTGAHTTRKPRLSPEIDGKSMTRTADRQEPESLPQLPPRRTR